ncbi:unnamed protein product [Calypogeia fissa]
MDPKLLFLLWVAGACAVATSIFAIHVLTVHVVQGLEEEFETENASMPYQEQLTVTIYTAPAPFEGSLGILQAKAIMSWLRLDPCPSIVLLGEHSSLHGFASKLAPNVTVDTDLDFTFSGRPFFHGMVRRARTCSSDIVMLIDPDLIVLDHVFRAIQTMRNFDQDWLITALPLAVKMFPFSIHGKNFESKEVYAPVEQVETYVRDHGIWDDCEGPQLWAWNGNRRPLHAGVMPPFVYKEGHHNHWLLSEAMTSKFRVVLDASEEFSVFRNQVASNSSAANKVYESGNSKLASTYGSYYFKGLNTCDISQKLLNCDRMKTQNFGIVNMSHNPCSCFPLRQRLTPENRNLPAVYRPPAWTSWFGALAGWNELITKTHADSYSIQKDEKSQGIKGSCNLLPYQNQIQCKDSKLHSSQIIDFSFSPSLESLVSRVASNDKVVILAVVGNSYRDMLMSWVCRLKHLKLSNYLVSALDDDLFHFASQQGLPVFRVSADMNVSRNNCHFGSACFKRVTKMKSRTVLQILQLGYHVLFSDVDVYWFEDPSTELMSFGRGHLPAQTDQWNETEALNKPRHLNSGFYFAWADNRTMAAFEGIIKHGATSDKSEQPSFYDVLCGEGGKYTVGIDTCVEPNLNITVHFLDPVKYPNGAFRSLWQHKDVRSACKTQGCKILHNNWVPGRQKKLNRQMASGLWDYDAATRMCLT